jgi:serine/threonine protein kinase
MLNKKNTEPIPEYISHYKILGRIGKGGMGDIYKAIQDPLNRIVALKVLPPQFGRDEEFAKRFEIESGHRLSKHPEKCRFPHGHTRAIEVVLGADSLDGNDMVCDYQALKTVVERELERFDHAMLLAATDPYRESFAPFGERVVLL